MVCDSRVRCCEWWNYVVNDMWVLLFVRQIVTSLSILGSFIQRLATIHQMEYWLWNTEIGYSHLIGFVFVISKCSQHKMIKFSIREKLGNYPKSLKTKSYRARVTRSQGINVTQWIEMRLVQVINDLSVTEPIPGDIQPPVGPGWWKIRKFLELKALDFLIWSRNSCHWSLQLVLSIFSPSMVYRCRWWSIINDWWNDLKVLWLFGIFVTFKRVNVSCVSVIQL